MEVERHLPVNWNSGTMELFTWIEALPLSAWVRESDSLFAYAGVLFFHTMGLGILVGTNIAVALLAMRSRASEALPMLTSFYGYMWLGFWINAVSGILLVMADATTKLTNPVFFVKMALVILAVGNMMLLRRALGAAAIRSRVNLFAVLSAVLWVGAIAAGRLMAYLGPVSGAPDLLN